MIVNTVRNVNQALAMGLQTLTGPYAASQHTRNGFTVSSLMPVTTVTTNPVERVLFSPLRDANPFFHLMESLWMLAGRNDLDWLCQYNKRMVEFSDDGGKTQPGAYGFRWREHFGYDQIDAVVEELTERPNSRRAVLSMWDAWGIHQTAEKEFIMNGDLLSAASSKDVPCNTHIYFRIIAQSLHMTVCCRSNDLWWGAHGANAVHFSVLQEYVAARLGVQVGTMTQMSNDYHAYTDIVHDFVSKARDAADNDLYTRGLHAGMVGATPMFHKNTMDLFEEDLPKFMDHFDPGLNPIAEPWDNGRRALTGLALSHPFLRDVALPMGLAWDAFKTKDMELARNTCHRVGALGSDWRAACVNWMNRRFNRHLAGGV